MKVFSVARWVISLVGLALLAGSGFLYTNTQSFLRTALKTQGMVVDLKVSSSSDSTTYSPVFRFTGPDDRQFEVISSTGSNPPGYSRGEAVEVLYQPDNPYDAKINGFFSLWGGASIVGGIGAVFLLVGIAIFVTPWLKTRKSKHLRHRGVPVVTRMISLQENSGVKASGRHPFRVTTQWQNPATSEIHVFTSENLWFDPTEYIKDRAITVFMDRDDSDEYWMDLSFLPQLAD